MYQKQHIRFELWNGLILGTFLVLISACNYSINYGDRPGVQTPSPTVDRLAEPVLPEEPTQYEQGRHLYWLNCMPCHGDQGQGLTDEFRGLWVEDHQDCWANGCHGGGKDDEGFPLPHTIPAIIYVSGDKAPFTTAEELFEYLKATHPPQRPGKLAEDEYWAITDYVLVDSGRMPANHEIGPQANTNQNGIWIAIAAGGVILITAGALMIYFRHRKRQVGWHPKIT